MLLQPLPSETGSARFPKSCRAIPPACKFEKSLRNSKGSTSALPLPFFRLLYHSQPQKPRPVNIRILKTVISVHIVGNKELSFPGQSGMRLCIIGIVAFAGNCKAGIMHKDGRFVLEYMVWRICNGCLDGRRVGKMCVYKQKFPFVLPGRNLRNAALRCNILRQRQKTLRYFRSKAAVRRQIFIPAEILDVLRQHTRRNKPPALTL